MHNNNNKALCRFSVVRVAPLSSSSSSSSSNNNEVEIEIDNDNDNRRRSTLTLLEHVNLNVPNHDYILDFYFDILGCGVDPRIAINLIDNNNNNNAAVVAPFSIEEGLVWPNMGASQFHLPRAEKAQSIPGHIGLRYKSLKGLKERLAAANTGQNGEYGIGNNRWCFSSSVIHSDVNGNNECITINDLYGNIFQCREGPEKLIEFKQPILLQQEVEVNVNNETTITEKRKNGLEEVAKKYGLKRDGNEETECRGIDYVEFHCPQGTAESIAEFYESVFDATTTVLHVEEDVNVALIAFGLIDDMGKAEQYLIFREITNDSTIIIPEYDGHHIALYVGTTKQDFEQVFRNARLANVVWVNPRFVDKVTTLSAAKSYNQFRFKDIIDIKNGGHTIFTVEHEIRSVEHSMWPGKKKEENEKK